MSNLYARLKAVSAQKSDAPKAQARKPCAVKRQYFEIAEKFALTPGDLAALCRMDGIPETEIDKLVFIDTETTGLGRGAGTVAFLVGIGWYEGGRFLCEQYWMRDYDEEEDLLCNLSRILGGDKTLVSFNGKSFDLPLLEGRYIMNRMRLELLPNIDLLLHARKIYKLRLKRVRLCFLEEMLLGEWRTDDLPGSEVPQRYFDYLKTGDMSLLDDVFRHNAIDVFTLSKLLKMFAVAYRSPEELTHGKDIFSVGRTYERKEDIASAERCYVLSKREYRVPSVLQLAFLCKRAKRTEDAIDYFLELAEESPQANVELAKYYEHHEKSYEAALECTDRAIALVDSQNELAVLFKRRKRLLAKLSDGRKGGSV